MQLAHDPNHVRDGGGDLDIVAFLLLDAEQLRDPAGIGVVPVLVDHVDEFAPLVG